MLQQIVLCMLERCGAFELATVAPTAGHWMDATHAVSTLHVGSPRLDALTLATNRSELQENKHTSMQAKTYSDSFRTTSAAMDPLHVSALEWRINISSPRVELR